MILDILTTDNDPGNVLQTPSKDAVPSPETSMLLHSMVDTLKVTPNAVGLAAPQVGVAVRAFVMGSEKQGYLAMLNPKITKRSHFRQKSTEGCLSRPGYSRTVQRPVSITVEGIDAEGNPVKMNAKGFAAAAICHEVDHLDGVLI